MNAIKGETPLVLKDGRKLTLVLDFEGLIAAETSYGKPLSVLMVDAQQGFVGAVRALFCGSLKAYHRELTEKQATDIMAANMKEVSEALANAGQVAFPREDEEPAGKEDKEDKESKKPVGKGSGRSGAKSA